MTEQEDPQREDELGDVADEIQRRVIEGYHSDRCAMCLTQTALLHPVGAAWACSRCHRPLPGAS